MGIFRKNKDKQPTAKELLDLQNEGAIETREVSDPSMSTEPAVQFEPYVLADPTLLTFVDPNSPNCIEELVCLYPWLSHLNYCGFTTPKEAEMFKMSFMAAVLQKGEEIDDLDIQILLDGFLYHVRNRIPNAIEGRLISALVEHKKTVRMIRETMQKKGLLSR